MIIFIKNIIKKNNIINYIITLFLIILFLNGSIVTKKYLDNLVYEQENSLINRTLLIEENVDCQEFKNAKISTCNNLENKTTLIFETHLDAIQVLEEYSKKYIITGFNITDENLNSMIKYMQILLTATFIILIGLIIIITIQYNNDDEKIIKILRSIGYSKKRICILNNLSLISIITLIFIVTFIIISIASYYISNNISTIYILKTYAIQYIIINLTTIVTYIIIYIIMHKMIK